MIPQQPGSEEGMGVRTIYAPHTSNVPLSDKCQSKNMFARGVKYLECIVVFPSIPKAQCLEPEIMCFPLLQTGDKKLLKY